MKPSRNERVRAALMQSWFSCRHHVQLPKQSPSLNDAVQCVEIAVVVVSLVVAVLAKRKRSRTCDHNRSPRRSRRHGLSRGCSRTRSGSRSRPRSRECIVRGWAVVPHMRCTCRTFYDQYLSAKSKVAAKIANIVRTSNLSGLQNLNNYICSCRLPCGRQSDMFRFFSLDT